MFQNCGLPMLLTTLPEGAAMFSITSSIQKYNYLKLNDKKCEVVIGNSAEKEVASWRSQGHKNNLGIEKVFVCIEPLDCCW